jgi:sulfur-oxidizing protein SoxZ
MAQARFDMPTQVRAGEVFKLRLLVQHPMETGYLLDVNNQRIARNVINDMRCTYAGLEVFRIEPSSGLSANPYVEFFLRATQSGEIVIDWVDDRGERGQVKRMLTVV